MKHLKTLIKTIGSAGLMLIASSSAFAASYSFDFNYRLDNSTTTDAVASLQFAENGSNVDVTLSTFDMSFLLSELGGTDGSNAPFVFSLSFGNTESYDDSLQASDQYDSFGGDANLKSFKEEKGKGTFDFGWIATFDSSNSGDRLISNESVTWTMLNANINDFISIITASGDSSLSTIAELHINAIENGNSVKYIADVTGGISPVPVPLPILLLLSGLVALGFASRKKQGTTV